MVSTRSTPHSHAAPRRARRALVRALVVSAALAFVCLLPTTELHAQQRYSRSFAPRGKVSLVLKNRSGLIEVQGWQRAEVRVTARIESPAARFTPSMTDDGLTIDVVSDNRGRDDVGDVNFYIQVPYDSAVDLQTTRGNITVRNVRGGHVRAHVTSEGDIELTDIRAPKVMAENVTGDILFDAELLSGGSYVLNSTQGVINMRIKPGSGFRVDCDRALYAQHQPQWLRQSRQLQLSRRQSPRHRSRRRRFGQDHHDQPARLDQPRAARHALTLDAARCAPLLSLPSVILHQGGCHHCPIQSRVCALSNAVRVCALQAHARST